MNDETVLASEETSDPGTEPVTSPDETQAAASGDGSVTEEENEISETMADVPTEEYVLEDGTEATEETLSMVTVDDLQAVGSAIMHADLAGSFLICGTLIGIVLWRNIRGI